jgi:Gluconate 2-dehydrogenase subunit 3
MVAESGEPTGDLSRRTVVAAMGLAPLASLAPSLIFESQARAAAGESFAFFTAHQAAVVKAAAARLVPGPDDDPTEKAKNSPGATEADVVRYIDTMLSMFKEHPPKIFAGGPWSDRHGGHVNHMKHFVPPVPRQLDAWKRRIHDLQKQYREAVKTLDAAAKGKSFVKATNAEKDKILIKHVNARNLIFGHTIEGMYAVPEYGGNKNTVGWKSISWPGDSQRLGYTPHQVQHSDGKDPVEMTDLVQLVLTLLPQASTAFFRVRGPNPTMLKPEDAQ